MVNNLRGPLPSIAGAAYHCQQACEKLIKAVLIAEGIEFARTHDIAALAGQIPEGSPLKHSLENFHALSAYGIAARYPMEDEWQMPSSEEIEGWLSALQELSTSVRKFLGK